MIAGNTQFHEDPLAKPGPVADADEPGLCLDSGEFVPAGTLGAIGSAEERNAFFGGLMNAVLDAVPLTRESAAQVRVENRTPHHVALGVEPFDVSGRPCTVIGKRVLRCSCDGGELKPMGGAQ